MWIRANGIVKNVDLEKVIKLSSRDLSQQVWEYFDEHGAKPYGKLFLFIFNDELVIFKTLTPNESSTSYCTRISFKQGDNLIDVLETSDIVATIHKDLYDIELYGYFEELKEEEYGNITKVITHEQYMPLAQEVK